MIEFKFPEEKTIALHYADLLGNTQAKEIIESGFVNDRKQALALTEFYWAMVEESVKDQGAGLAILTNEGVEFWMEYIFHTFNGYLVSNGYEAEWDTE
jgi:hypothetical protein